MQVLVFVLHDLDRLPAVLAAWTAAGARGVTVLESSGTGQLSGAALRQGLPLFPSMDDLLEQAVERRHTLFTVTDDGQLVSRIAAATQAVVGDLGQPHTGILFTVPVSMALGVHAVQHLDTEVTGGDEREGTASGD